MEKLRTQVARKYCLLSCHRYQTFTGHKTYDESLILTITNNGGSISFTFTDLSTNGVITFDNPKTGEYIVPLKKGSKTKMVIKASKAIGAYNIKKRTVAL